MKPGKQFFLLLLLFISTASFAQLKGEERIDSMTKALPGLKEDTNKVNLLDDISYGYRDFNPDKGLEYAAQDLALATKLGWKKGIAYAHMGYGLNYMSSSKIPEALEHYNIALRLFREIKYSRGEATVLGNIGSAYSDMGESVTALAYYRKQLDLAARTNNKKDHAFALGQIANVYNRQAKYDSAISFYNMAIKLNEEMGKKSGIAINLLNIATIYTVKADYTKATGYYLKAKKIYEETGDKHHLASVYANMGAVYAAMHNREKALEHFSKALQLHEDVGDKVGMGFALVNIGAIYHEKRDHKNALKYYSASLDICEETGDKEGIAWAAGSLGEIFAEQRDALAGITYCLKALRISEYIGEPRAIATTMRQLASAYVSLAADSIQQTVSREYLQKKFVADKSIPSGKQQQLNEAIKYYRHALDTAISIGSTDITLVCYAGLSKAYELKGDYKSALFYSDKANNFSDSVYSKEQERKIMEVSMQHEYAQKRMADSLHNIEKQAVTTARLQRQRAYTVTGVSLAAMLALITVVVTRNNKKLSKEQHRSEDLLLNILPTEVAKELKEKGEADTQYYENVTVLFTDFVSFTKSAENMTPKALIDELHFCFKAFDEITSKYKIEKIKTIGDAYLAVAGLPVPDEEHAIHAMRAAVEIRDFMRQRYAHIGNRSFEIRIGVHSGSVVAGIVGVKKFAYDIWGDTVNTAARMEQNSEPGEINISESTYQLVKNKFICNYRGEIEAKNKGMMRMYFVS